jgi:hypothetical protein
MSSTLTRTPKTKAASKTALPSKVVARAPAVEATAKHGNAETQAAALAEAQEAPRLSAAERDRLIALAAYFRAEKRGFAPGCELQDWVEAEAEVQRLIGSA